MIVGKAKKQTAFRLKCKFLVLVFGYLMKAEATKGVVHGNLR